ncbi:LysM peptidoglycan-binding domain-containing protein, partial [Sphingomonas sp. DT-204]|uniref:LysM peptidoglycan-binding domain-containing protein n=1 Tax=Sphingomonas sp. DT-204 TaxID=3396166 RepID=UPI003F1AF0A6
ASVAEFDGAYAAINSYQQGASGGSYTVQAGDTLAGIAAQLWGDANLWYKLAQANGLTGDAPLIEGQSLTVPAGVVRSSNSAATFKPYEVGDAYGDTSPTTPKPRAAKKNNKCGVFGQVLLVAVAVAVSVATYGALTAPATATVTGATAVGTGALAGLTAPTLAISSGGILAGGGLAGVAAGGIAGAAGSIVSQGLGVATGLQSSFNWTDVALAGIGGGLGRGLGAVKAANGALDDALRSDSEMLTMFESEVPGIGAAVSRPGGRQTPQDWTWEHASTSTANGRSGVMRLVPTEQHTPGSQWWRALHPDAGARGGYSEWAIPAGAPKNR